jgi:uncharacterized Rmd1/YagE family protein
MRCFAYSFPSTFNTKEVVNILSKNYNVSELGGVVYFSQQTSSDDNLMSNSDVFVFPYGAMVCWNISEELEKQLIVNLSMCFVEKLGAEDDDTFSYSYSGIGDKAKIHADHIVLPNSHTRTKLAFSHGFAQSVKLGGFENTIQNIIEHTKQLPQNLATKGKILLSRKEIRKLMGKIFIDRDSINLHLDLLDVPNFFWDEPDLEAIHEMVTKYLDQEKRVAILNHKLSVIQQLLDMLVNELHVQHSSNLEWIIIILLCIEICLALFR